MNSGSRSERENSSKRSGSLPSPPAQRPSVFHGAAFWLVTYVFTVIMLGNTLPTPLYVIFQSQWHFASGMITLIFATYAVGVLAALLLAGRSSDQIGRIRVLGAALTFSAASSISFILASGLAWLFAGRLLSGVSAGLVTGTATATLSDLAGPALQRRASIVATAATTGGLGLGPLLAGWLSQNASNPTVLVFQVHLVLLALGAVSIKLVPETVTSRSHLAIRFAGFQIPGPAKRQFLSAGAAGFAAVALLGLFTALAPSLLGDVLNVASRSVGGLIVFSLFALSTLTQIALGRVSSRSSLRLGLVVLILAMALLAAALQEASFAMFLVATLVAGLGVGAAFIGSLAIANRLAPSDIRAQVMSTYFTFSYLGLTIPVIAVGYAAQFIGFVRAIFGCSIGLAAVCTLALGLGKGPQTSTRPHDV